MTQILARLGEPGAGFKNLVSLYFFSKLLPKNGLELDSPPNAPLEKPFGWKLLKPFASEPLNALSHDEANKTLAPDPMRSPQGWQCPIVTAKMMRMKIAIIGSGISGLSAAWLLSEYSPHHITIYEKNDYLGGHTHTIDYSAPDGDKAHTIPVDTGFIVFNTITYPNLIRFFTLKGIAYQDSEMSFSVSRDNGRFEWAGTDLTTIFSQKSNLLRLGHWRMLYDILKFNYCAPVMLTLQEGHPDRDLTLGEYLDREGYSKEFRDNYLLPMTAAIWSTPPDQCATEFPVYTLIRFMHNHCLMQISHRPQWLTVCHGSRNYIQALTSKVDEVRLATPVKRVLRKGGKVVVLDEKGNDETYDQVVFASHADETLALLGEDATPEEREILGSVKFSENVAVVHCDEKLMPMRKSAWTSWNYLSQSTATSQYKNQVSLTYWMNNLQPFIPKEVPIFVTLNPLHPPKASLTYATYRYTHPQYTSELIKAQAELPSIQGKYSVWFAGAWTGYGFHEDGFLSGVRVAQAMGASTPFRIYDNKEIRQVKEGLGGPSGDLARMLFKALDVLGLCLAQVLGVFGIIPLLLMNHMRKPKLTLRSHSQ
ncbi:uncharacterized protein VTP21DRAFT_4506 [Calcarisporiella thermophila]|uniref:uncharacterized protein n=1 Tax=Calcarisporiella thermophila TaxID=911321 RepID=UPI00374449F2